MFYYILNYIPIIQYSTHDMRNIIIYLLTIAYSPYSTPLTRTHAHTFLITLIVPPSIITIAEILLYYNNTRVKSLSKSHSNIVHAYNHIMIWYVRKLAVSHASEIRNIITLARRFRLIK